MRGPFTVLLHSPPIAERTAQLGAYIRFETTLDPKVVELAVLAAKGSPGSRDRQVGLTVRDVCEYFRGDGSDHRLFRAV